MKAPSVFYLCSSKWTSTVTKTEKLLVENKNTNYQCHKEGALFKHYSITECLRDDTTLLCIEHYFCIHVTFYYQTIGIQFFFC